MTDAVDTKGSETAEKAYAAAAQDAVAKADAMIGSPELEFPAKPKRASAAAKAAKVAAAKPAAQPTMIEADLVTPDQQPAVAEPAVAETNETPRKAEAEMPEAPQAQTVIPPVLQPKETIMTTTKTNDFVQTVKAAAADVQTKAKIAFAKGGEVLGEASAFTKGNVEAVVTSGKVLTAGLQGLGKTYATEGKTAYETVTADVKELAAVKSPVDFVRVQTAILRRNFDHAFAFGGKNSETVLKLAEDVIAPISARANLALQAVKKAA